MLNWLIPSTIGKHRLYSERILVVNIRAHSISSALILKKKDSFVLENFLKKDFEYQENSSKKLFYDKEKLKETLEQIFSDFGSYDELWILAPGQQAIFKEIQVPFSDELKIEKILPFEMDQYLVFPSDEVESSFIVTKHNTENESTNITVATIKIADFQKIGIIFSYMNRYCNKIGIDTLVLFELVKNLTENQHDLFTSFLEITQHSISIGFISNGSLSNVKNFNFGLQDLINKIIQSLPTIYSLESVKRILEEEGLKTSDPEMQKIIMHFFEPLKHSIETQMLTQTALDQPIKIYLFFSPESKIKNLDIFLTDYLNLSVETFDTNQFIERSNLTVKKNEYLDFVGFFIKEIGFVTSNKFSFFNLGKSIFPTADKHIVKKQILLACILIVFIFGYGIHKSYSNITKLSKAVSQKEQEVLSSLKSIAPAEALISKRISVKELFAKTEEFIKNKTHLQKISSYNAKSTPDILVTLLEITRLIDKTRFGVEIVNFSITQNPEDYTYKISLEGIFDKTKSLSSVDDFSSFSRVISLSRRFVLLNPIQQQSETADGKMGFSLTLGVTDNENSR